MLSRKFKIQNASFAMPRDQPATTYYILTEKLLHLAALNCGHTTSFSSFASAQNLFAPQQKETQGAGWIGPLRPAMLKQVLAHIILISTKRLLDLAPKCRINEDGGNQSDFRGAHEPRKTSSERSRMDARK